VPNRETVTSSQLQDHVGVFLSDIAKALVILDEGRAEPALLTDGAEIQRLISELHGAQRCRLGWSEAAVRREFEILHEEVAHALAPDAERGALEIVHALVDAAARVSVAGFRRAGGRAVARRASRGAGRGARVTGRNRTDRPAWVCLCPARAGCDAGGGGGAP
jgi:hypothetical protein